VTIYYDALAAMRARPERYRFILDRIARYSLAPVYHIAPIPGEPGRIIGVAERAYPQAFYDARRREGFVQKEYLLLDIPGVDAMLPASLGMGPYAHQWRQEGDRLYIYYVGYHKGLTRMLYRVGERPLKRFRVENLARRLVPKNVDGAPPSKIMRFRHLNPGLGGKMFFTGTDVANRGGNAYSGGLLYFDTRTLDARYKLSRMSRCHNTGQMAWRIVLEPTGKPTQEIYLGGNFNPRYAPLLPPDRRPKNRGPKIFAYEDRSPSGVRDLFAMNLVPRTLEGKAAFRSVAFSKDQLFLLVLLRNGEGTVLASLDMTAGAFADVKRLPNGLLSFIKPNTTFIAAPGGRVMICAWDDEKHLSATFTEILVAADGRLAFRPHLTLLGGTAGALHGGAPIGFLPDARGDGSYDLMIGSRGAYGGRPETRLQLIEDFIPPRAATSPERTAKTPAYGAAK